MAEIFLAGGCFWGLEKAMSLLDGVLDTECGYANGDPRLMPDYMLVCSGRFGYRETVKVVYDPVVIPLERILFAFFLVIDPTQERRQGNDVGEQYRTGIYWTDEDSAKRVTAFIENIRDKYPEFHTEIGPLTQYSRAESEHQSYLSRNPGGYCHIPWEMMDMLAELGGRRRWLRPVHHN